MMRFLSITLLFLLYSNFATADYFHLELGAGNYGQEGHTRKALFTTYGANKVEIAQPETFFNDIPQDASQAQLPLHAEKQYRVLFITLDELVKRNPGEQIVFHVNDLVAEWADYASVKLREYANNKGYNVIVESVPGNYFELNTQTAYDSVHLKNFELMYSETIQSVNCQGVYHDRLVVTAASRQRMREGLQKVANLGKRGLHLFILNTNDYFPGLERTEYSMRGKFYLNTTEWKGYGYDLPDGLWSAPERMSHVFFIASSFLRAPAE
jgi:hypothetical protein